MTLDKIKEYANQILDKLITFQKPIAWVSGVYIAFILIVAITWYGAWWYKSLHSPSPDLSSLLQFINTIIGPTAIGLVTFIAGLFIDTNKNGIPDNIEKRNNTNDGRHQNYYNNQNGNNSETNNSTGFTGSIYDNNSSSSSGPKAAK